MDLHSAYRINDPDVIADSIQGETLIINLNNGLYYSTDGIGDEIWRRLQDQWSAGQIIEALTARYPAEASTVREEVFAFMSELVADGLVVRAGPIPTEARKLDASVEQVAPFSTPVLQRYTDYQELLLLDPVHEVVESSGWPVAKPQAGA